MDKARLWRAVISVCSCLVGCAPLEVEQARSDQYLLSKDTPLAMEARRALLPPSARDRSQREITALQILGRQDPEDGSWNHDPTATGHALLELHALNLLPRDDPAVKRAVSFLLGRDVPAVTDQADSPAWGKDWVALYALNLWGYGEELKVGATIRALLDEPDHYLGGKNGRCASAVLRCLTTHPLLREPERRELILSKLAAAQRPDGTWDLGPGTDDLAVLCALLALAGEPAARVQILRFMPNVLPAALGEPSPLLHPKVLRVEEVHLTILQALKLAGLLEPYRKCITRPPDEALSLLLEHLAPYRIGLYLLARERGKGHSIPYGDERVRVVAEPILLGTEITGSDQVLSPRQGEGPWVHLSLKKQAQEKLARLLSADASAQVALVVDGKAVAVQALAELLREDKIAVKGLAEENAARLVQTVSVLETPVAQPPDTSRGGGTPGPEEKK